MTIIDFLSEADHLTPGYKAAQTKFVGHEHFRVLNGQNLLERLLQGNFNKNKLLILAHGGPTGIASASSNGQTVTYVDILNSLNEIENHEPFELNLAAVCNSIAIEEYNNLFPPSLSILWCSENETSSIDAAFIINKFRDSGIAMLEEKGKYKNIIV
jgi:hypothetical protein